MVQSDLRTKLPPLENGDRLNRYKFEHRYNATPHLKKAELMIEERCGGQARLAGNMANVLTSLQTQITSPEHQIFVQQLSKGNES